MSTSKVGINGITTIPYKIRKSMGLEQGDLICWWHTPSEDVKVRKVKLGEE